MTTFNKNAYYEGIYTALEKLGMAMPPPIPAAAKALANPGRQRTLDAISKLQKGSHPSQLGVSPNSPNKSLQVMI